MASYTEQDLLDEYSDLSSGWKTRALASVLGSGQEIRAFANVLGKETEVQNTGNSSPTTEMTETPPTTATFNLSAFVPLPAELRFQILEQLLPPFGTELRTPHRNVPQICLRLPVDIAKALVPYQQISRSFKAELIPLLLSRCNIFVRHTSVLESLVLLKKSEFFNYAGANVCLRGLRRVEWKWAPMAQGGQKQLEQFCTLLSGATGLVELTVYIPLYWWLPDRVIVWKKLFRMVLENAPRLRHIKLRKYEDVRQPGQSQTGWGVWWVERDAGILTLTDN